MTSHITIQGGWRHDPPEVDRILSRIQRPRFGAETAHLAGSGTDQTAFLYKAFKEVNNGHYPDYPAQKIGDCVSQAFGHGVDLLEAVQISIHESAEFWTPTATEAIYGMARIDIGRLNEMTGDGAVGAWGAEAVSTLGTLSRALVGPYDGNRAREWGAKGVPPDLAAKASAHKVRTASLVSSYRELEDASANGYPVVVCSPNGFTSQRDCDGFCSPQGTWYHAMLIVGIRAEPRPGACFFQSWGPTVPSGPLVFDQPSNSFWVDRLIVEQMLAAGDSWSISQFEGYPRQELPARWTYEGFA